MGRRRKATQTGTKPKRSRRPRGCAARSSGRERPERQRDSRSGCPSQQPAEFQGDLTMGRTLEALKQVTPGYPRERAAPLARVPQAAKDAPPLQADWPEDVAQEPDIQFVGVGGPRVPPQVPPTTAPLVGSPSPVVPDGPRLMTVLFRPLPFEPATRPSRSRFAPELV